MERVACVHLFVVQSAFTAHFAPPFCVSNWDSLNLQFGFSCGAFVAQHVQGSALDYGFILDNDAKAFFHSFF